MLSQFLYGLSVCVDFFLMVSKQVWVLYTNEPILMSVIALFIIRKVVDIFGLVKG